VGFGPGSSSTFLFFLFSLFSLFSLKFIFCLFLDFKIQS
jgi:hypothetical protein